MKAIKIIISFGIIPLWLIVTIGYLILNELEGFYLIQLLFIPLILSGLLAKQYPVVALSIFSFWIAIIWGVLNMPFRNLFIYVPFSILLYNIIRYIIATKEVIVKLIGIQFVVLILLIVLKSLDIANSQILNIVMFFDLVLFPILMVVLLRSYSNSSYKFIYYISVVLILANIILKNLGIFGLSSLDARIELISTFFIIIVLAIMLMRSKGRVEFGNLNVVLSSYLAYLIFSSFLEWIVFSLKRMN